MRQHYQKELESRLVIPTLQFLHRERSSGIVLGIFVLLALVLANSPFREAYTHFLEHHFGFSINGQTYLDFSLEHWINDGLMSMFFFVVGLELKREFIGGELRDLRKVTLPVVAALCGMLFPAAIYLIFNAGAATSQGWGIPMATDIAFALAVLQLLGNRVPMSAKVFLTTLAIVDDLGSVVIIALFYTTEISFASLAIGFVVLTVMFAGNRLGVKSVWFYGILGIGGVWVAFLTSGVHATISAVLAAMVIPADARIPEAAFLARIRKLTRQFENAAPNDVRTLEPEQVEILARVQADSSRAIPPLQRLEHGLHPLVAFVVMPIFALANAGISFVDLNFGAVFSNGVAIGVMAGLLVGKPVGIVFAVWITERLGFGRRLRGMTWQRVWGLGFLAGIGFTMSMFITMLAFTSPENAIQSKLGIFAASIVGGIAGYIILRKSSYGRGERT
ncbi:Na+/H+ antiporter NhaA [Hoylesella loescheii]|jgi:Na+/H+ antiporter nhaA|uniref:Na+/H+ antiporter NhaA n=1 Tax=Hoylesella loescheii TaxID=840 RepID=UPI0028E37C2B|nr:Na+/H+ antiporter NhaA [Hoylesella loescheii]